MLNNNHPKIPTLKVSKNGNLNNSYNVALDEKLNAEYDFQIGVGKLLYDLFWTIDDFGILIDMYLNNHETYFSGNAYCGEIIDNNKIQFKDYEENFIHEMDFDEFMRINKEYHDLYRRKANDIWFKMINGKIILEAVWLDNNSNSK